MRRLDGLRIVVTRAAHQAEELAAPLRDIGADVILLPVIAIAPPIDSEPLRRAAQHCDDYDWIIFTSANAISAFAGELPFGAGESKARIATVGAATRDAAEAQGFYVSITPEKYVSESLVEAFAEEDLQGGRILIPSAAVTRDVVPAELRKRGAQVDVVEAYRNVIPGEAAERARAVFREPYPDWVTFASSSAVENLIKLAGAAPLSRVKIASIGPVTSRSVRLYGLNVAAEAAASTIAGLVNAVASFKT